MPPGEFVQFNGLWARGHSDNTPPDHFTDCLNVMYKKGFRQRDGHSLFHATSNIVRMHLYKPNPPFAGTNIPRPIALTSTGVLKDVLTGATLHTDTDWLDFALVNFFGRCYISPHDGKVGLTGETLYVYDGTTFRVAGGVRPSNPLSIVASIGTGTLGIGTYLISYAWESDTGFISQPAPWNYLDSFGQYRADLTNIAVGPAGTVARWIIATKLVPDFGVPTYRPNIATGFDASDDSAETLPLYFAHRIDDNTTTAYNLSFYDENLRDSADYLFTLRETIPAGVGLLDFKGRLVTYGIFEDPSLVLASEPGEPEAHSETSGFFITDPTDSTGVRCATEFRDTLYVYKRQRGYMTQDNGDTPSTWDVLNFEKSVGSEQYGIAAMMDAKGSSSEGFLIASVGGLYYFNGILIEPEMTYKIQDLWKRINEHFFHKVQLALDPINKRIYILVPLDEAESVSHIIFGDYSDGLSAKAIKWSLWQYEVSPTSILIYTDFEDDTPSTVTRMSTRDRIIELTINIPGSDFGSEVQSFVEFPPIRLGYGVSQFDRLRLRATGPSIFTFTAYSQDKAFSKTLVPINVLSTNPGREYQRKFNLVNEQCRLRLDMSDANYLVNGIIVEGSELWEERPQ